MTTSTERPTRTGFTLADAGQAVVIEEVSQTGQVPTLRVTNGADRPVLTAAELAAEPMRRRSRSGPEPIALSGTHSDSAAPRRPGSVMDCAAGGRSDHFRQAWPIGSGPSTASP